jgi:lysophospholipase L1-like esterase
MLGAAPDLQAQGIVVDAKVGRQAKEGVEIVRTLAANGLLGDVLIVHLGTNGPTTAERFDEILQQASGVRLVILLTAKAPKPWIADVNRAIYSVAGNYPNVRLIDWYGLSQSTLAPADTFYNDGIHLRPAGRTFYTQLILETIAKG